MKEPKKTGSVDHHTSPNQNTIDASSQDSGSTLNEPEKPRFWVVLIFMKKLVIRIFKRLYLIFRSKVKILFKSARRFYVISKSKVKILFKSVRRFYVISKSKIKKISSKLISSFKRNLSKKKKSAYSYVFRNSAYYFKNKAIEMVFTESVTEYSPDVIHAHDLATLPTAHAIALNTGSSVVYDAHELEVHRNPPLPFFKRNYVRHYEKKFARKSKGVITVSNEIADHLAVEYGIEKPTLIMNAPRLKEREIWPADPKPQTVRLWNDKLTTLNTIRECVDEHEDGVPIGVYVGKVTINRGVEIILEALLHTNFKLVTIGPVAQKSFEELEVLATKLGVECRWTHQEPVHPDDLVDFISTADFAIHSLIPVTKSYNWAMPNKLFETTLAGLPMITSDAYSVAKFVTENKLGTVYANSDAKDCARAINDLMENVAKYKPTAEKLKALRNDHSWKAQERRLFELYDKISNAAKE